MKEDRLPVTVLTTIAICLCLLLLTGCSATQINSLAGYAEGRANELRATNTARSRAKHDASYRVHCGAPNLALLDAMQPAQREAFGRYCGYEWLR